MHRISPRPWINGSPAHAYVEQMMTVHRALEAAAEQMRRWQPHGRDYQIGAGCDAAYREDYAEYIRRLKIVEELAAQYESEAYSISRVEV